MLFAFNLGSKNALLHLCKTLWENAGMSQLRKSNCLGPLYIWVFSAFLPFPKFLCVYMYKWVKARGGSQVSLYMLLFWGQGLWTELELTDFTGWLASKSQELSCLCLSSTGITNADCHAWHFMCVLGIWTHVLMLAMHFTNWATSSSHTSFFIEHSECSNTNKPKPIFWDEHIACSTKFPRESILNINFHINHLGIWFNCSLRCSTPWDGT